MVRFLAGKDMVTASHELNSLKTLENTETNTRQLLLENDVLKQLPASVWSCLGPERLTVKDGKVALVPGWGTTSKVLTMLSVSVIFEMQVWNIWILSPYFKQMDGDEQHAQRNSVLEGFIDAYQCLITSPLQDGFHSIFLFYFPCANSTTSTTSTISTLFLPISYSCNDL